LERERGEKVGKNSHGGTQRKRKSGKRKVVDIKSSS
jgi:hypothetical protein